MCDQYSVILVLASGGSLIYAYGYYYYIYGDIALAVGYFYLKVEDLVLVFYYDVALSWYYLFSDLQGLLTSICSRLSFYDGEMEYHVYSHWVLPIIQIVFFFWVECIWWLTSLELSLAEMFSCQPSLNVLNEYSK
jgi:hypothetical protein